MIVSIHISIIVLKSLDSSKIFPNTLLKSGGTYSQKVFTSSRQRIWEARTRRARA